MKPDRANSLAWARQAQVSEPSSQRLQRFAELVWNAAMEEAANKAMLVADNGIVTSNTIRELKVTE